MEAYTTRSHVQVRFTFEDGCSIRVNGREVPIAMSDVEERYGESALTSIMETHGDYLTVAGMPQEYAEPCVTLRPVMTQVQKVNPALWPVMPVDAA
jgi:hypothetical protein